MRFGLKILPIAKSDIQGSIKWYNERQVGLGKRFHAEVKESFELLRTNPFFQNRYDTIRCLPLKKFPFMVHFSVEETKKQVVIHAVFHTSLHPKVWKAER